MRCVGLGAEVLTYLPTSAPRIGMREPVLCGNGRFPRGLTLDNTVTAGDMPRATGRTAIRPCSSSGESSSVIGSLALTTRQWYPGNCPRFQHVLKAGRFVPFTPERKFAMAALTEDINSQPTVVALGGNAFAAPNKPLTMASQFEFAESALSQLHPLLGADTRLLIAHGNGPQVGHLLMRAEAALGKAYAVPLEVCVAESEGELGYVLEQSLYNVLAQRGSQRPIASLLSQVLVSADDPAFAHPTKPIGMFYDRSQAAELERHGFRMCEDAGRGYRRVVPSPSPREILGVDVVRALLDLGVIVIAAGGGGIPVIRRDGRLHGVAAVVDKDLTAALLADQIDARLLLILTDVPCAYRDFNTPHQRPIGRTSTRELAALGKAGHFAAGSMAPKIEAAIAFVSRPERRAVICNPDSLVAALAGAAGTVVEHSEA